MKQGLFYTLIFMSTLVFSGLTAQNIGDDDKYWIFFKDKPDYQNIQPEQLLSSKALERRRRMGIPLDIHDYPVLLNCYFLKARVTIL